MYIRNMRSLDVKVLDGLPLDDYGADSNQSREIPAISGTIRQGSRDKSAYMSF